MMQRYKKNQSVVPPFHIFCPKGQGAQVAVSGPLRAVAGRATVAVQSSGGRGTIRMAAAARSSRGRRTSNLQKIRRKLSFVVVFD